MNYRATFIYGKDGEHCASVTQACGVAAEPPVVRDDAEYKFVGWDREIVAEREDVTYRAIYTRLVSPEQLKKAYTAPLFAYLCHNGRDAQQACPIFLLAYHEHEDPKGGPIRDRLLEQLDALCGKGTAPDFDAWPNFSYPILSSTVAIVRDTPTVWDILTPMQKAKLDTLMEAFAYICSVSTSDYNTYHTGPGLRGNFYKTWNPNYRFANVTSILFSVYYFGAGDMKAGADIVNGKLKSFDEDAYCDIVRRFEEYGWNFAYDCWTKNGVTAGNGETSDSTAKQLLVNGGTIVHTTNNGMGLQSSTGVGVSNGGNDYRYTGYLNTPFTLYECERIVEDMIAYNYAAGAIKSEHWADGNGDGVDEKVAGILDGKISPYQGQIGMMTEFASGVRSSTGYCSEDFIMIVAILSATSILPRRNDEKERVFYDYTENEELWRKIQIGNEDFLYKYYAGYQSYAHGSYGISSKLSSEAQNAGTGYYMMKDVWRTVMKPKGDVEIYENLIG